MTHQWQCFEAHADAAHDDAEEDQEYEHAEL